MPVLFLVGGPNHRQGTHTIHSPKLNPENGHPATGADKGLVSTVFNDGVANVDDAGTAKWLCEGRYASTVLVPAYGLQQPGIGPKFAQDEATGAVFEVEPAKPADLPGADPAPAKK